MIAFSHPLALLLALPAAWLLWRSRRRTTETHAVANLFLWMDGGAHARTRGQHRALPPWLAWVQALVLVAVAIAIAQPFTKSAQPEAALVIDLSLSMSARDSGTSRLALAGSSAKDWLSHQPTGRRVQLIGAGAVPRAIGIVSAGSSDAGSEIDRLESDTSSGNIAGAIEIARRETAGPIAVISDLPSPAASTTLGITWRQAGSPVDNVAVTRLSGTPDGGAILEVSNFGSAARDVDIHVTGGATPWRANTRIDASASRAFALAPEADRTLVATISVDAAGDAIAADNRRQTEIRRRAIRVVLAANDTKDTPTLEAALGALPDVTIEPGELNGATPRGDVLVTTNAPAPAAIPALVFKPGGPSPVITRSETNGIRHVDVAIDLAKTDWTLQPAFPLFVADAVDWLAGRAPDGLTPADAASIAESDTRQAASPSLPALSIAPAPAPSTTYWMALIVLAAIGAAADLAMRRRALGARLAAAALLGASLAGVSLPFGGSDRSAVILVDESVSVSSAQRKASARVRLETDAASGGDHIDTMRFGGAETDIAAGLRSARAALPAAGTRRLLLLSDGQETDEDSLDEARKAGAAGVPIDVVPIDSRAPAYISRVDAPVTARAGAPVPVRTAIDGAPNELVRLTVSRDGHQLDARRIVLNASGRASVEITDRPIRAGVTFYRASLTDDQSDAPISESGAATTVAGRGRVLLVTDQPASAALFRSATSLDVETMAPSLVPDTPDALASYSAVVVDGVALHRFSARQLDAIAAAVTRDEAGLLLLGGRDSLDPSEFAPGAFSEALPIDFTLLPKPPATRTALALLVDISGSMASTSDGVTKIAAARDAITRALAILPKTDAVQVIGFAEQPVILITPEDPRDAAAVEGKLKSLAPSGSTAIAPAANAAAAWLKRASAERRRLLLVTDGKTSMTDAEATRAAVRGQSIEVSVVAIGRDAERDWLTELAASTGGRAYFPDRVTDLSREVAREAARGVSGREVNERFVVRPGAHALAPGAPAPELGGYIAGRLRDGAVAAWKGPADDPVLAAWSHGLGRVAAFASDVHGQWGAPLAGWSGSAAFWRRTIEWLARPSDLTDIETQLTNENGASRLVVELARAAPAKSAQHLPTISARVTTPSGHVFSTRLHAVTSSRFEASVPLAEPGNYRAAVTIDDPASGSATRVSRGWYWTGDRESQARGMNTALLEGIARASGGRMLPVLGAPAGSSDTVFGLPRTRQPLDAAPWLLLAALILLSVDYVRRAAEVL